MYEENWQVRFSECNKNHELTYNGIVNYFQDCSNLQSESLKVGLDYLTKRNRAWVLDFWQIVIERKPKAFEKIKVQTWANGFKGFFGTRNFVMKSANDEMLAFANSSWVYLDTATGRPVRITEAESGTYPVEEPLEMEAVSRKIEVPKELVLIDEVEVKSHHIDVYCHMNNGRYIELAADYLLEGEEIRQVCCQYKKQARLGDRIKVYQCIAKERITVVLKDAEDSIYAVVSFDRK